MNNHKDLSYVLTGFIDADKNQDNLNKLLMAMNKSEIFANDGFENYESVVDFMISKKTSFYQLENLTQEQIDFLIREVDKI